MTAEGHGERSPGHEPFDPDYLRDLVEKHFGPIAQAYFRPRFLGLQRLPRHGPAILAANHSGTAFPYDGMVLDALLWQREGYDPERKCRSVFEKELAVTWWMRPWGIDNFWRRGAGVDMTFDNFDRLLERGERVLYYPEGVPGIGKGFQHRYQLQRFSSSFVILAARHRAPVVPIHIVNAEWVIPFNFTVRPLDRLMQKVFHVPFLPLPAAPLGIVFPWMWYLALPARMVFVVGRPLDIGAYLAEAGVTDVSESAELDRAALRRVAERVRREMQAELDRHVARYGRAPYHWRSLRRELRRHRGQWSRILPWGWCLAFVRHERDRQRPTARGRLHAWLRDWDLLFFYLPFGWPLLSLARRLRRPPCGFRGLSARERRDREGAYHWHLRDHPLPARGSRPAEAP